MRKILLAALAAVIAASLGVGLAVAAVHKHPLSHAGNGARRAQSVAGHPVLLGDANIGATSDGGKGSSEAFGYTASVTGTATSMNAYLTSKTGAGLGLYADNGSKPGVLLNSCTLTWNTPGWTSCPLVKGVAITAGTRYWIVVYAGSSWKTVTYRDTVANGTSLDYSGTGLANPYSTSHQWHNDPASLYVGGTTGTTTSTTTTPTTTSTTPTTTTTTPTTTTTTPTTTTTTPTTSTTSTTTTTPPPPPPAGCTKTDSNLASVASDEASAGNGDTICIAPGSYGALTLSGGHTAAVTVKAANGYGSVTVTSLSLGAAANFVNVDGLIVAGPTQVGLPFNSDNAPSNVQITNTDSEGFSLNAGGANYLFDHDFSHDGPYGFLLSGSQHPWPGAPAVSSASWPRIKNVTISNSSITRPQADAFQVKGYENLTITHNDIYNVVQNGNHNDGVQTVFGGMNLTITHNVFRDGNVELFMLKDGTDEGTNVISDNLAFNNSSANNPACGGCGTDVAGADVGPVNATIEHNTFVDPPLVLHNMSGGGDGNPDYLPVSNVTVDHNVISMFRPQDDVNGDTEGVFSSHMTESNDIFGTWSANWLPAGPGTTFNAPAFKCGSACGSGTGQSEDYELASNPNGIGIDWNPATQTYGPAAGQ
jgi:Right handed beta helix region